MGLCVLLFQPANACKSGTVEESGILHRAHTSTRRSASYPSSLCGRRLQCGLAQPAALPPTQAIPEYFLRHWWKVFVGGSKTVQK
jgi:hypothetical protein